MGYVTYAWMVEKVLPNGNLSGKVLKLKDLSWVPIKYGHRFPSRAAAQAYCEELCLERTEARPVEHCFED